MHYQFRTVEASLQLTTPVNRCCGDQRVRLLLLQREKNCAGKLSNSMGKRSAAWTLGSQDHVTEESMVKTQRISLPERVTVILAE